MIHRTHVLNTQSGIPIVVQNIPENKNVGYMIAIATGSRDESDSILGISHLLEHVVFRRTKTRDSYQISKEIEGAGGEINAFTGREMTAFYGVTIHETANILKDVISDIVVNPSINENDTELEKKIVLQELEMIKSEPDSYIHDLFESFIWRGHPLSQDEGGNEYIVSHMRAHDLREYYMERYKIPNIYVYATGPVDISDTLSWAESTFDCMGNGHRNKRLAPRKPISQYKFVENQTEHCHIAMGFPAYGSSDKYQMALTILSTILGSGTSSRLFQTIREQKALVYSVYTTISQYSDASSLTAYMSCTNKNVIQTIETVKDVILKLIDNGLENGELDRAKRLTKGINIRTMESTENSLYKLGMHHILNNKTESLEEMLVKIDNVTCEDIMHVANDVLRGDHLNIVVLGTGNDKIKNYDNFNLNS